MAELVPSVSANPLISEISSPSFAQVKIKLMKNKKEVYSCVSRFIEGLSQDSIPLLIVPIGGCELRNFVNDHRYQDGGNRPVTVNDLTDAMHQFPNDCHPGRYLFVPPEILATLDVSACQILCYNPSVIPALTSLTPRVFTFFMLKSRFSRLKSTAPLQFLSAFNFEQHPCFPSHYDCNDSCILDRSSKTLGPLPFPDMREFSKDIAEKIRQYFEVPPCPDCGAVLLAGMPVGFCCRPFADRIRNHLPPPMNQQLLNRIIELTESDPNFARILNRDLRPVLQHASVSSPNAAASNLFISGIPYAVDSYRQFLTPVYAIFSRNDRGMQAAPDHIGQLIAFILSQNPTLRGYLRDRFDSAKEIAMVSMNEPDEGLNLAIFNAEGVWLNDHAIEILRDTYHPQKVSQFQMLYDQLVYPVIFWNGSGGCGIEPSEKPQGATTLIRKVLISLILQPRNHFIHHLKTLREEFICAVYGRLINLNIKFLAQAQRQCFAREDEIRGENSENIPKEYGLRTFIPPSLIGSDEYWHQVAMKCFAISTQLGPPTFFLTFTMNPYWVDYQALKRGNDTFADSAMTAIIFKTKLSALMKFLKARKILGKISAFAWRVEYQKRGLPHAHILFWSDFDTQDIHAVETAINVRYPKDSPFLDDERMTIDFRQLINSYQIHHHSIRCRQSGGKCRFGYPQDISDQTKIRAHRYFFARGPDETNIVPHNPLILAYFRCHHCLEIIHSDQCIGYVLKYCSKNSDSGQITLQNVLYEGRSVDRSDKLHYYAATRIASASECFAGISGYWRHHMTPTVQILGIHLPGQKIILRSDPADALEKVDIPSPLERYFGRPVANCYDGLTYLDYHSQYSIDSHPSSTESDADVCQPIRFAHRRKKPILCILHSVHPRNHELFALRLLLRRFSARNWEALRTDNGVTYPTFYEAARQFGLVANRDEEAEICLQDAIELGRPPSDLRFLLAQMVYYGASRTFLEFRFQAQLADDNDTIDSVRRKIDLLLNPESHTSSAPQDGDEMPHIEASDESLVGLTTEQRMVASKIIQTVISKTDQLMFLQGAAGTGKTYTVKALISALQSRRMKCLICATTGIAAVQYPGGTTLHSLFHLGIDEEFTGSFQSHIGRTTPQANYILSADLIIIDEVSMLTPWVAKRVSLTLQSISDEERLEFGGKQILFVGDLLQLPPVVSNFSMPVIYRLITRLPYWHSIRKFRLETPMRAPQPLWTAFLLSVAKGRTEDLWNWRQVGERFGVTLTKNVVEAKDFLCLGLRPRNPFPLDRQWISATNKLVNQVNRDLQEWRRREAQSLGIVSALTELLKPLPNCPGLSEAHQVDFIERIDTPDLPPNDIELLEGDPFILLRNIDTRSGLAKGRRCHAIEMRNRTVVLQFDNNETRVLTRIPMEKTSNGMRFVRWQLPLRLLFAGTVHRSQGMTLQRAVIDCRTKFWEHGQLYVALSRVTDPRHLCILLPPDVEDYLIRPSVDLDVVQILEKMDCSTPSGIVPPFSADQPNPGLSSSENLEPNSSSDLICPDQCFEISDDEFDPVPGLSDDPGEIIDPAPAERLPNPDVISGILEDQQLLRSNCLGPALAEIDRTGIRLPVSTILRHGIETCQRKFLSMTKPRRCFHPNASFMHTLLESRILLSRFLVLYRITRSIDFDEAKWQSQMIAEVIGPGILNHFSTCYINAFVQILFYILPLRLLIVSWPNRNPTIDKLRLLLRNMSRDQLTSADSLSTVCEPDIAGYKDCSEFATLIFQAIHDSSSGRLKSTIEDLICFRLTTRFGGEFSRRSTTEPPSFLLHLPVAGASNLTECLNAFFSLIENDSEGLEPRQHFICSFPRFLLIHLSRYVWIGDQLEKICRRIAFPVVLDMTPYAVDRRRSHQYGLVGVISHLGRSQQHGGHYITFLRVFGQWIRFDDTQVDPVDQSSAIEDNFPDAELSTQTASILLYMSSN